VIPGATDAGSGPVPLPEPTCTPDPRPRTGFVPLSVPVAVTKVKNLLVGLPATEAEVQEVVANPAALQELVTRWMALPLYEEKMRRFFVSAFQQDQFIYEQFVFQFVQYYPFHVEAPQLIENVQQAFGRTVMQLIAEGQPFTSTMTTTRFMMTPAMMASYAILDSFSVDDNYIMRDTFQREHPTSLTLQSARMIPFEASVDPASPDFMIFYHPGVAAPFAPDCPHGTVVYPSPVDYQTLANFLYSYNDRPNPLRSNACLAPMVPPSARLVRPSDFTTWRMVTIRPPRAGESTTPLYDLPSMRAGRDLVLNTPRVGFYTTPAFYARWPTNGSNLARVLINQTMIVGLGRAIDLTNATAPPDLTAVDRAHAPPDSTCYGCHQSLDPMRQFFRNSFTLYGSPQDSLRERSTPGQFAFHGVSATGTGIASLGAQMAAHHLFAPAWVQRLCTYATSAMCDESDPEFVRLVGVFRDSNFSWNALVQALFSSPLVTFLRETRTAASAGQTFPIARQEHLCATLSARLEIPDVCGLDITTSTRRASVANTLASSWPSGQYSRGNAQPSLAVAPSLLMRGGMESICADMAQRLVDRATPNHFPSTNPALGIGNVVTRLMGLFGERAAGPQMILQSHFTAAVQAGASPVEAMQSTFVLGCLSPYVAGVGQ
jgi:hypothetical protein